MKNQEPKNTKAVKPRKVKNAKAVKPGEARAIKAIQQSAVANFSALLVGDTLGELVSKIDIGEPDARLIVILVGSSNQIQLTHSKGISRAELLGTLYMAVDQIAMNGRD